MPHVRRDLHATAPRHAGPVHLAAFAEPVDPTSPRARPRRGAPHRLVAAGCALAAVALCVPVAWQQWGSNLAAARSQHDLAEQLATAPALGLAAPAAGTELPGEAAAAPSPAGGDGATTGDGGAGGDGGGDDGSGVSGARAYARITAPAIDLDAIMVAGVGRADLRLGPGWMPQSAEPGTAGNAVVSGHRTTYGAPFRRLDELVPGDRVTVARPGHPDAVYEVRGTRVVAPGDTWVAAPTPGARLTLTTCHPEGSDRQRLVVQAELVAGDAVASALGADGWSFSPRP